MVLESLQAAGNLLRGYPRESADGYLKIPERIATQCVWEYQLGFMLLESGSPEEAGEHFRTALELDPDLAIAPLLRYYMDKIGVPAPDPSEPQAALDSQMEGGSPDAPSTGGSIPLTPLVTPASAPARLRQRPRCLRRRRLRGACRRVRSRLIPQPPRSVVELSRRSRGFSGDPFDKATESWNPIRLLNLSVDNLHDCRLK